MSFSSKMKTLTIIILYNITRLKIPTNTYKPTYSIKNSVHCIKCIRIKTNANFAFILQMKFMYLLNLYFLLTSICIENSTC